MLQAVLITSRNFLVALPDLFLYGITDQSLLYMKFVQDRILSRPVETA